MTLVLVNTKDQSVDFHVSYPAWNTTLFLGLINGWTPEGVDPPIWVDSVTREPLIKEFPPMAYNSNDGQEVRESDAINLAQALERGLRKIPEFKISLAMLRAIYKPDSVKQEIWYGIFDGKDLLFSVPRNPISYFSGAKGRSFLKELIAFLQRGKFYIL